MEIDLPDGWQLKNIHQIVSKEGIFIDGDWIESKDQDQNGEVRLIQLADLGDGVFKNKSSRFLTLKRAHELNCTFLREGDILVARMPDPIGRACIFPLKGDSKFVTAVDVGIIRPESDDINVKFLSYLINSPKKRNEIEALQSGTTRKRISRKNLGTILFPIPPVTEQHQIVEKIEELFSELDKGIENLKMAQQQLKIYRQAVLKWAFEGKLTNENVKDGELPGGWETKNLKQIAAKITDGEHATPKRTNQGALLLSARNIHNGYLKLENVDYIPTDEYERIIKRCHPEPGDILISCSGSVGRVCLVPPNLKFTMVRSVALLKLNWNLFCPKFFEYQLQSSTLQKQIEKGKKATAQANLFIGPIGNLQVVICSLKQQIKIVEEIESRLSVCDKMEETITNSLQQAEALRQSILKRAFEGKLVENKCYETA